MKVFLILLSLAFIGCNKTVAPNVEPSPSPRILPLAIGNWWARESTVYDTSGNEVSTQLDTIRVLRDTVMDGKMWFIVFDQMEYFLRNTDQGLWMGYSGGEALEYKFPATVADSFQFATNTNPTTVVSIDSTLTIKAGTFSCYCYFTSLSYPTVRAQWYDFYSPTIGFVYTEYYQSFNGSTKLYLYGTRYLIAYNVN